MLHQLGNKSTSFSIFFPISGSKQQAMEEGSYSSSSYANPSSSSSVDCTLSLGPPSSSGLAAHERSSAAPASFCWDIISQSKATHPSSSAAAAASRMPNNAAAAASNNMGGDPLLPARRCANCDTTSTPLWRNGPRGPKSLCNACGIRYKKEERRAAASTAATPPSAAAAGGNDQANNIGYTNYQRQQQHISSWAAANSGRIDDDVDQVPYLSWRLNVVPQPTTLFQYQ